jgi:putative tricarboxylic transport membrane protein
MKTKIINIFTAMLLGVCVSVVSAAETVEIIVPAQNGGPQDRAGRALQSSLTTIDPTRNYVVINRPGAAGQIGYNASTKPGGNPKLMIFATGVFIEVTSNLGINRVTDDVEILGPVWSNNLIFIASEKSKIKNIEQLIQRGQSGRLNCGVSNRYSEMIFHLFAKQNQFKNAELVLTKSTGEVANLIMSGSVDCAVESVESAFPGLWKDGRVAILAHGSTKPTKLLPGVPMLKSYMPAHSNFSAEFWQTIAIPKSNTEQFKKEIRPILDKVIKAQKSTETTYVRPTQEMDPNFFIHYYVNTQKMMINGKAK